VEPTAQLPEDQEESTGGTTPDAADTEEGEEQAGEEDTSAGAAFEATIVRLDRKAAESLARLAGM
jgi:hypothetical protein